LVRREGMKNETRRLRQEGHDEKRFREFIREQAKELLRMGFDRREAEASAREICAMYRHHFRTWK
jgi:hypothetical protein